MEIPTLKYIKEKYYGQITNGEIERLSYLASLVPENGIIVEIGAYKGKSTAAIAYGMKPSVFLISMDPHMLLNYQSKQGYETSETLLEYVNNLKPWGQRIVQIMNYPLNVAKFLPNTKFIDMIFIDCCKNYEDIYPIWKTYLPKCKNIISSHDYVENPSSSQHYPGVVKAINELVKPITTNHHHIDFTFSAFLK
jgi:predicted O-methyltransferase YrrM